MEKVGIEINLINADEALATLKNIEASTKRLGTRRTKIQMEDGSLVSVDERIKQIQDRLAALSAAKKMGVITKAEVQEAKRLSAELKVIQRGVKDATANAKTFGQVFNSISSKVAHVGSAMQSMGNALTRVGSFMRPITTGLLMGAGYKALNLFTEGFDNAFQRADTMRNYDRQLKALGLDVEQTFKVMGKEAMTAKENLDAAVQGLPTSLDEIMAAQKVYAGATGEMVESTKTAIAANNTFLASGMGAREQRFMQKYLVAMASGAELTTTQWQSMARIAPLAMRAVSRELGYADDEYAQFTKDVQKGTISGKEFLKAFQTVGVSGVIADAARAQTESWNGLFSNIRIAVTRMGANVLDTLNQTFKDATGRTLLQRLLGWDAEGKDLQDGIKSWINGISESVQNWIKANPDRIIEFFNNLKSIDFKGLLKGMAEGLGDIIGILEKLAKLAADKDMSKVGRFLAKAGFYGRALTIFGGLLKGMRHPIAGIGTIGSWLFRGRKAGGFFGKIAEFFGKKQDIETAGNIGGAIGKASPNLLSAFKNMALLSGIMATPAITAWGVTEAVKRSIKNFKETINLLKDMDWGAAAKLAGGIAAFLGASAGLGWVVGKFGIGAGVDIMIGEVIVGLITSIATGFADLNMALIKGSIKKFVESIRLLNDIPDVSSFGDVKTKISNAIEMMNEITSLLNGEWTGPGMHEGGISNVGLGAVIGINTLAKALAPMKDAVQRINEIASMSISEGAVNNIGKIIDAISEIQSKMWKLMGFGFGNIKNNMTKVADAMYELRRIIYHVNKLGSEKINDAGLKNVGDAISKIREAFDARAIADLRATITTFVAAIQDALTQFDVFNKPIEIKATVKLSKNFKTSVDTTVKQIESAKGRIRRAWNGIPTSFSKTITFTLKARVIADNLYAGASKAREIAASVHPAKGGLIYRAKGGGVPWKRVGTDTVPAMLTPGEYVHNKRAVSAFGIDFMRKVNNLDMKGAMNELMHRAGHMANINRGTSITNNNYNNQKVVINNSNAGAGYTFKTASRFVGAF